MSVTTPPYIGEGGGVDGCRSNRRHCFGGRSPFTLVLTGASHRKAAGHGVAAIGPASQMRPALLVAALASSGPARTSRLQKMPRVSASRRRAIRWTSPATVLARCSPSRICVRPGRSSRITGVEPTLRPLGPDRDSNPGLEPCRDHRAWVTGYAPTEDVRSRTRYRTHLVAIAICIIVALWHCAPSAPRAATAAVPRETRHGSLRPDADVGDRFQSTDSRTAASLAVCALLVSSESGLRPSTGRCRSPSRCSASSASTTAATPSSV